jgi:hypothetical protein
MSKRKLDRQLRYGSLAMIIIYALGSLVVGTAFLNLIPQIWVLVIWIALGIIFLVLGVALNAHYKDWQDEQEFPELAAIHRLRHDTLALRREEKRIDRFSRTILKSKK